jgi:hypothetical protein
MGLADVISEMATVLSDVAMDFGSDRLNAQAQVPPRVTWVPTPDSFGGAQRTGPGYTPLARSVVTRQGGVTLHVWGAGARSSTDKYKDLRATELLVDRVICALKQVAWGAYSLEGGSWADAGPGNWGRVYMLNVRFKFPVVPQPANDANTTVTITSLQEVGTEGLPSGDVTGDPAP